MLSEVFGGLIDVADRLAEASEESVEQVLGQSVEAVGSDLGREWHMAKRTS
jgi:hypothetical protein